jgi:hypothetical protein
LLRPDDGESPQNSWDPAFGLNSLFKLKDLNYPLFLPFCGKTRVNQVGIATIWPNQQ